MTTKVNFGVEDYLTVKFEVSKQNIYYALIVKNKEEYDMVNVKKLNLK